MASKSSLSIRQRPPELTGDPRTDWILWELSLILSDIARNARPETTRARRSDEHPPAHTVQTAGIEEVQG